MKKLSLLSLVFLLASPLVAQKKAIPAQSLLWEIKGNGLSKPSYLFGTNHLLTDAYLQTLPVVLQKFNASEGVVTEMVFDSSKMMNLAMQMLMRDSTLRKLLPPADYAVVDSVFAAEVHMPLSMFNSMKPIATEVMLTEAIADKVVPAQELEGERMDLYFMNQAKKQGKVLNGLESMEEQVKILMSSSSLSEQAQHLASLARDMDKAVKELQLLMDLYKRQQLDSIYSATTLMEFSPQQETLLLENRNMDWINKLPAYMQSRSTFIAVGALHLPGEKGLLNQLRKMGYTVKPLSVAN